MGRIFKKIYGFEDSLVVINFLVFCFEMYFIFLFVLEIVVFRMFFFFVDLLLFLFYLKYSGSLIIFNGIMFYGFCK